MQGVYGWLVDIYQYRDSEKFWVSSENITKIKYFHSTEGNVRIEIIFQIAETLKMYWKLHLNFHSDFMEEDRKRNCQDGGS